MMLPSRRRPWSAVRSLLQPTFSVALRSASIVPENLASIHPNVGFEQTVNLSGYKIVLNGDARYRGNRVIGFEYLPQQNSGSDVTLDASITLAEIDDKWSLTGWVRNITDERVPVISQFAGSSGNAVTTGYAPPRTYGARLRYKF
jgi:iron complex outermembrane recepter protein